MIIMKNMWLIILENFGHIGKMWCFMNSEIWQTSLDIERNDYLTILIINKLVFNEYLNLMHGFQDAAKSKNQNAYDKFVESAWRSTKDCTIRGQFEFNNSPEPLDIDQVEPAVNIVKRFVTGENNVTA